MRVTIVTPYYPPSIGGVETAVRAQAEALARLGHTVHVYTQTEADGPEAALGDGPVVHRFRSMTRSDRYPVAPALLPAVRAAARRSDVVHVHDYHGAAALAALAVDRDVPVVFTPHLHGGGHTPFARMLHVAHGPLGRRLFDRAERVVSVSHAEASIVRSRFPSVAGRIEVIHNGLELRVRPEPGGAGTRPLLVTLGRLEEYKRTDLAVRAMAALPDWELAVLGSGPAARTLMRLAAELGVAGRVHFPGRVADAELARWLGRAHAFVSMSGREAFGLSVLEAAAWGIPVVASDIAAHAEVAGLAPGGLTLVPAGIAPARLAGIIATVAKPMTEAVLSPWVGDLTWDRVGMALSRLYDDLTGRPDLNPHDIDDPIGPGRPHRSSPAGSL